MVRIGLAVVWSLVLCLVAGDLNRVASQDRPPSLSVDDEPTRRHLRQAREHLDNNRHPEALVLLQRVLDSDDELFITRQDSKGWEPARQIAERLICEHGLLRDYRSQHEAHAEHLLSTAVDDTAVSKLEELSRRYLLTVAGAKGAGRLASIYLDRGQASLALMHLERLCNCPAHKETITPPVRAKLAVACGLLGRQQQALSQLELIRRLASNADLAEREVAPIRKLVEQPFPETTSTPTITNELLLLRSLQGDGQELRVKALQALSRVSAAAGYKEDAIALERVAEPAAPAQARKPSGQPLKIEAALQPTEAVSPAPAALLYPRADRLPFFSGRGLAVFEHDDQVELSLLRLADGTVHQKVTAPPASGDRTATLDDFAAEGHFAFAVYRGTVYAISGLDGRLMWSYKLPEGNVRLAVVNTEYVALTVDRHLLVLDALGGKPLWGHGPLPDDHLVFGDTSTLYVNVDAEGTLFDLYRPTDGTVLERRPFETNLVRYCFTSYGRKVVVVQLDFTRGGLVTYCLDTATQSEDWTHVTKLGTRYFRGEDGELILLEPRGLLQVIDTASGQPVLEDELSLELANKVSGVRYFSDGRRKYVLLDVRGTRRKSEHANARLNLVPVDGPVRAYEGPGKPIWEADIQAQWIIRRPLDPLPALLMLTPQVDTGKRGANLQLELRDKLTGEPAGRFQLPISLSELYISSLGGIPTFTGPGQALQLRLTQ